MIQHETPTRLCARRSVGALLVRVVADAEGVISWAPTVEIRGAPLPVLVYGYHGRASSPDTVEAAADFIAHKVADWIAQGRLRRDPMHHSAWIYTRPCA